MAKTTKLKENGSYEVPEDTTICITAREKVNIYLTDDEDGLNIKVYPIDETSDVPVADTYLNYDDPLLKSSDDIDGERDNEAAVAGSE